MEQSGTVVMMGLQHENRWSAFADNKGIENLSKILTPEQLKTIELLAEFDTEFLKEISPDVSIGRWNADAVIFEAGAYLDVAFYVMDGEVEVSLPKGKGATGSQTKLAAMDIDLAASETVRLGHGELFGEIGALNGWPQSVTARTTKPCTLLQLRLPALRKLRRKSKQLKKRLDELYRARTLRQHLASTAVLEGCSSEVLEALVAQVDLVSFQPGDIVTKEGEPVEHLILVRSGSLKMTQQLGVGEIVVSYVSKGQTLGESELLVDEASTWQVSATSVGYSEIVTIPRGQFAQIIALQPELEQRLWAIAMERIKEIGARRNDLQRSDLLDFSISKGIAQATSVLVIDLETCTRCDDCVRGCASTHGGTPRFVREGEVYDGFLVVRSCYHCEDPLCLIGCPTGAIRRANVRDVVEIDPAICIGCGACAENCVYDSIVINDLGITWGADAMPKHLRGQPRAVASKCDLCNTAPEGPACVSSCPHGAASRVSGAESFDVLLQAKRVGAGAR